MPKCPDCDSTVPSGYAYCTKCGAEMPNSTKSFVYDQLSELVKAQSRNPVIK